MIIKQTDKINDIILIELVIYNFICLCFYFFIQRGLENGSNYH